MKDLELMAAKVLSSWNPHMTTHLMPKLGKGILEALREVRKDAYRECAEISKGTRFKRICQVHGHADGEIAWTFNGCKEIYDAILAKMEDLK